MNLALSRAQEAAIRRHGEETYPEECCGFLFGRDEEGPRGRTVMQLQPTANERDDSRHNRYVISPETYLRAEAEAERQGLEIVGFYHSHPDAEARPSEFDRQHALPFVSYVIVAVSGGEAKTMTSWRLTEDHSRFEPEPLTLT